MKTYSSLIDKVRFIGISFTQPQLMDRKMNFFEQIIFP